MRKLSIDLFDVRIQRSGMAGGFLYVCGKTQFEPYGEVNVYAYFSDTGEEEKEEQDQFESGYGGGNLRLTSDSWKYIKGIGLDLQNIAWENT